MLKPSTFRVIALALGLLGLVATILVSTVFWFAIGAGAAFGVGGYLFDYFTHARYGGGQVSAWAFAAGGAIVAFYWSRTFVIEGHSQVPVWAPAIQYAAVVLLCWAALMFGLPSKHDEP